MNRTLQKIATYLEHQKRNPDTLIKQLDQSIRTLTIVVPSLIINICITTMIQTAQNTASILKTLKAKL